ATQSWNSGGECREPLYDSLFPIPHSRCRRRLQRPLHFDALEALDLVAGLDVVVLLDADAAFGAGTHLLDIVLEAAQRLEFALEDDRVVTQHADRLAALD